MNGSVFPRILGLQPAWHDAGLRQENCHVTYSVLSGIFARLFYTFFHMTSAQMRPENEIKRDSAGCWTEWRTAQRKAHLFKLNMTPKLCGVDLLYFQINLPHSSVCATFSSHCLIAVCQGCLQNVNFKLFVPFFGPRPLFPMHLAKLNCQSKTHLCAIRSSSCLFTCWSVESELKGQRFAPLNSWPPATSTRLLSGPANIEPVSQVFSAPTEFDCC